MEERDTKPTKTLLRDEQGGISMARTLLLGQLIYVGFLSVFPSLADASLTAEWWTYNGTISIGLIAWAAGPRGLQYLAPRVSKVATAIKDAATARINRTDDRYNDDERGS